MRTLLGGLLLAAGIGGLGLWGAKDHARKIEAQITGLATQVAASSIHSVSATVSGRDIIVTGVADTEAERDQILAKLNDVTGRRVVADRLRVLPMAAPFETAAELTGGVIRLNGNIPTRAARDQLADVAGSDGLRLASGAPQGWGEAMQSLLAALAPLDMGTAMLSDLSITLNGAAATPVEHDLALTALAELPEGFQAETMIDIIDDGIPDFTLTYDAGALSRIAGRLPRDLGLGEIAAALGLSGLTGDAFNSFGDDAGALSDLNALGAWLSQFDLLTLTRRDGATQVDGQVLPGADLELISQGMAAGLPGAALNLSATTRSATEGEERINVRSGLTERFSDGFWLPVVSFAPDAESCDMQSSQTLDQTRINFVTGSARLDAQALHGVNALAAVVRPCVAQAALKLELGGHTDSTGDAAANQTLSALRAEAVRQALVARGVSSNAMIAVGYGATLPIASNETEEGRAANRRTTVTWSN